MDSARRSRWRYKSRCKEWRGKSENMNSFIYCFSRSFLSFSFPHSLQQPHHRSTVLMHWHSHSFLSSLLNQTSKEQSAVSSTGERRGDQEDWLVLGVWGDAVSIVFSLSGLWAFVYVVQVNVVYCCLAGGKWGVQSAEWHHRKAKSNVMTN